MKARLTGLLVLALACAGVSPHDGLRAWGPSVAIAQSADVAAAQSLYDQGRFAAAADTIRDGLSSGRIIGGQVVDARELLARCQVKMGDASGARRTFLTILRQDPGYRPDRLRVPPDEMAVFDAARRQFRAEQEHAATRLPASLAFHVGIGSGANKDFGEFVAAGGGSEEYDNDALIGGIVRFPLAPRFSMDILIERLHATNEDAFGAGGTSVVSYEITALPVSLSLSYLLLDGERFRAYAFGGGGPMLETSSSFRILDLLVADDKVGAYLHGGLEGEYRAHPRFSITGRLLGRYAKATGLFEDTDLEFYTAGVSIADRDVDFSGFAATLGVRAYVGY